MRRYFLEKYELEGDLITISGDVFHHIMHVCRRSQGDHFEILFGDGKAYLVEVCEHKKKSAKLKIIEEREIPPIKAPYIHLVLSFPKPAVFSSVIEKAVELGVKEVIPVVSDFSHFKTLDHPGMQKQDRWQKIVLSACQQSGRGEVMSIAVPQSLAQFLESFNRNGPVAGLFAYEGESAISWQEALDDLKKQQPQDIYLFVGSEGGYSAKEIQAFQQVGLQAMSMGGQVLRVETACVALLSSLTYEFRL